MNDMNDWFGQFDSPEAHAIKMGGGQTIGGGFLGGRGGLMPLPGYQGGPQPVKPWQGAPEAWRGTPPPMGPPPAADEYGRWQGGLQGGPQPWQGAVPTLATMGRAGEAVTGLGRSVGHAIGGMFGRHQGGSGNVGGVGAAGVSQGSGVIVQTPDGRQLRVPETHLAEALQRGATRLS